MKFESYPTPQKLCGPWYSRLLSRGPSNTMDPCPRPPPGLSDRSRRRGQAEVPPVALRRPDFRISHRLAPQALSRRFHQALHSCVRRPETLAGRVALGRRSQKQHFLHELASIEVVEVVV